MTAQERFQVQFNRCFRLTKPKRIPRVETGIEKELKEQMEAERMWKELKEK